MGHSKFCVLSLNGKIKKQPYRVVMRYNVPIKTGYFKVMAVVTT